ncbi:myozenin-2a isoform X1 [Ictalurus furcatus]|uniref:myozenin-2a isoform X1 n=1 Tax=Ictalurus furcatus TaxID=66913 RepID=UPI0023501915|nr:myozenin-2a isoform X1 [Ictalurus furcatus]
MSQHSLMTIRERKMQAAAICREIQGTDGSEMDLGRKMNTPKEIMLEELSLASNRGSRLFKMRQKRSEKYTFENIQNASIYMNDDLIPPTQSIETTDMKTEVNCVGVDQASKTLPNTPDQHTMPNPASIAPGYGGPLKDVPTEKFNRTAIPKSYHSPWDQALSSDPSLADMVYLQMPESEPTPQMPQYKSFNRVATPFGGFGNAPKAPVKSVEVNVLPSAFSLPPPENVAGPLPSRPSFNRTALGWVTDGAPLLLASATLEPKSSRLPMFIPESDEL